MIRPGRSGHPSQLSWACVTSSPSRPIISRRSTLIYGAAALQAAPSNVTNSVALSVLICYERMSKQWSTVLPFESGAFTFACILLTAIV